MGIPWVRGEGNCARVESLGSDHHLLLPAHWAHVAFGTRAGEKTWDLWSAGGQNCGAISYKLYIYVYVCVYTHT